MPNYYGQHLSREEFDQWQAEKRVEYAAITIEWGGVSRRLRFLVPVATQFYLVTLDDEVLYSGCAFERAAHAYENVTSIGDFLELGVQKEGT